MIRFRRPESEPEQHPPENLAERLTGRSPVVQEVAELSDYQTVRHWLRELQGAHDQQVFVHRPWGVVVAVASRGCPVSVLMSDGEKVWFARPRTTMGVVDLTADQVEHVIVDALASPGPPRWPVWEEL